MAEKQQAIVYIDGYNLYYGMRDAFGNRYKWLDMQALSEELLKPDMTLATVKYFTAITKSSASSRHRQEIYLKALEAHCGKLEIYYGRFLSKPHRCRNCGNEYARYEEKKTDVSIACQIINDVHLDHCDCCYIVSGDSDLAPPLEIVRNTYSSKQVIVAHPPRRKSAELCNIASGWFSISEKKFRSCQLPETVKTAHGNELSRPTEWK